MTSEIIHSPARELAPGGVNGFGFSLHLRLANCVGVQLVVSAMTIVRPWRNPSS
jgi:hypothetical protein